MQVSDEQLKIIIREAVSSSVPSTLTSLGIDANDAIKTQAHMAAIREIAVMIDDDEFRADLIYLRRWRKSMEQASNVGIKTAVGIVVTGIFGMIVLGIREWIGR